MNTKRVFKSFLSHYVITYLFTRYFACDLTAPPGKGVGGAMGGAIVPDPQFILLLSDVSLYNCTSILILFSFVPLV